MASNLGQVGQICRRLGCALLFTAVTLLTLAIGIGSPETAAAATTQATLTRVVVLGVEHSAQLVSSQYQPAVFTAFFNRVKPAAICIERDPDDYALDSFYEFTYEQQDIAVPYSLRTGVPLFPVDWVPPTGDQELVWGVTDISTPEMLRQPSGFHGFLVFDKPTDLHRTLFFGDDPDEQKQVDDWYDSKRVLGERDFSRRLELYRTFMQAMRIKHVAERFPGQTILVVIGNEHQYDIRQILGADKSLEVVEASTYGSPTPEQVQQEIRPQDLGAIASFNLLGVQSRTGNVDWAWLSDVAERLQKIAPGPATDLYTTRLGVLTGKLPPEKAVAAYMALLERTPPSLHFDYTGVTDPSRVDSFFDPFGNLTVRERLYVELARECYKLGHYDRMAHFQDLLLTSDDLTHLKCAEIRGYWQLYVEKMK
jgi:hypothetical protein